MIADPITLLQKILAEHLRAAGSTTSDVQIDGALSSRTRWGPHVLERQSRRGWYIHAVTPETDAWATRIKRAQQTESGLQVAIACPNYLLNDEWFLGCCDDLGASLLSFSSRRETFSFESTYHSVPDLVYENRIKLSLDGAKNILDRCLVRALAEKNDQRKGVLLEVLVAVVLSQVDGFEVAQRGISNRTQQMDVLVHNRNSSGALGNSPIVLAEAKNWPRNPVGPTEYSAFIRKLQSRHGRSKLGFLVTTGRFTKGVADERRRDSQGDTLVVLIDGADLPKLWHDTRGITHTVEQLILTEAVGV